MSLANDTATAVSHPEWQLTLHSTQHGTTPGLEAQSPVLREGRKELRPIDDTQWHLLVASVDAAGSALFVDGVLVANYSSQEEQSPFPLKTAIRLGAPPGGALDQVRLYARALSELEVEALFTLGAGLDREYHQRRDVSWNDADALCAGYGKRLCSRQQYCTTLVHSTGTGLQPVWPVDTEHSSPLRDGVSIHNGVVAPTSDGADSWIRLSNDRLTGTNATHKFSHILQPHTPVCQFIPQADHSSADTQQSHANVLCCDPQPGCRDVGSLSHCALLRKLGQCGDPSAQFSCKASCGLCLQEPEHQWECLTDRSQSAVIHSPLLTQPSTGDCAASLVLSVSHLDVLHVRV